MHCASRCKLVTHTFFSFSVCCPFIFRDWSAPPPSPPAYSPPCRFADPGNATLKAQLADLRLQSSDWSMSGGKNYDSTTLENDLAAATRSNNSEDVACTAEDILAEIEEQIKATAAADQWDGEKKLAAPAMMYSSATRNSQPISQPISDLYGGTSSSGRLRQGGTRSGDGAIAAAAGGRAPSAPWCTWPCW